MGETPKQTDGGQKDPKVTGAANTGNTDTGVKEVVEQAQQVIIQNAEQAVKATAAKAPAPTTAATPPATNAATAAKAAVPAPATPVRPAAPAFRITPVMQITNWLNLLVYGDYGVGKSWLAADADTVPEMNDVLYISVESGEKTLDVNSGIDVIKISNYQQFARVHEFIRIHCKARDANDIEYLRKLEANFRYMKPDGTLYTPADIVKPKKYKTVVVDSLTEVQKYCMYQLLGISIGDFALDMEPDNPQFAEWGRSAEMIRLLVRTFRDLPMNTIFVCAKQVDQDEKKQYHHKPALPGKLADEVQGFFDAVGLLIASPQEGGAMKRRLFLTPGASYQAKNRFRGWMGQYLDNPTMADIYKLNKGIW